MKVILLCAGYATRLYPLTENQPKPILPIAARPILEYILERVQTIHGVDAVLIATNHKFAPHFQNWSARKGKDYPWPVIVVDDQTTSNDDRLGAIGDLDYVLKKKHIGREDLLVVAGDNLFDFDLRYFVEAAEKKRPSAVIAVFDVGDRVLAQQYGIVKLSEEGQVADFLEKPKNPPTTLASCGIYWLPHETRVLLDRYLSERHNADQPGHYMRWLAQTDRLFAVPLKGCWYDIGDLASYQKANAQFEEIREHS